MPLASGRRSPRCSFVATLSAERDAARADVDRERAHGEQRVSDLRQTYDTQLADLRAEATKLRRRPTWTRPRVRRASLGSGEYQVVLDRKAELMGVLDWVRRAVSGGRGVVAGAGDAVTVGEGSVHVRVSMHAGTGCVELGGTTTNSREHAQRLFTDAGYPSGGLIYRDGVLVPEPDNEVDPHAVAVHITGERAGYLPSWLVARIVDDLEAGTVVPVQLWAVVDGDELRVRAFAWLGAGEPQWDFDASKPAPVTPAQKKALLAQQAAELREKRLADGGATAEIQRNAMVRGKHYTEWPEGVRELKREQRYDEALVLLYELIAAAERDASRQNYGAPAPWYTEQAAIVHRKLKDFDGEIAVLERYRASHRSAATAFGDRLEKAVALKDKAAQ